MFTRFIILIFLSTSVIGCQQNSEPETTCQQFFMPPEVLELGSEDLYKEAIWQVYKFNLTQTDSFKINNPLYVDNVYKETSLSEFDLEFNGINKVADTISLSFIFERGVYPVGYTYFGTVAFWGDEERIEIGDRISFVVERDIYESAFREYLRENEGRLSPMLKCLVAERQGLKDKK